MIMSNREWIWVFHRGVIYPFLLCPTTHDLLLLLFYTTVSLDFGSCLISELTTHSPRMVNNPYYALAPDLTRCYCAYGMQGMPHYVTCIISNSRQIIFSFITNLMSICQRSCISIILFTHRMLFNYQVTGRK